MKKILVGLTTLALLAFVAGPALALCYGGGCGDGSDDQEVKDNDGTLVVNKVTASSITGSNGIANSTNYQVSAGYHAEISSDNNNNWIKTGNATAYAGAANVVNSNVSACCGDLDDQEVYDNNHTGVGNKVDAVAVTGANGIGNSGNTYVSAYGGDISSDNDNNWIKTGDATAYAGAANVVNSNVSACCGDLDDQEVYDNNHTGVENKVDAAAQSGFNSIAESNNKHVSVGCYGGDISSDNDGNSINTGNAFSAAGAITVVNSNITRSW